MKETVQIRTSEGIKYGSVREIKCVKVKGSYGSYFVQTKFLSDGERDLLIMTGFLIVMALIF